MLALPAPTAIDVEVAGVKPPLVALSVKIPAVVIDRPENVATPLTAATVVVPPRAAPMPASVTSWLPEVGWPSASRMATDAPNTAPAVTEVGGWAEKASWVAGAAATVKTGAGDLRVKTWPSLQEAEFFAATLNV